MSQHDRDFLEETLNTAVPAIPVAGSLNDILSKADSNTYDNTTDALEALSDKIGAYTADGGVSVDDSVKAELDIMNAKLVVSNTGATTTGVIVQDGTTGAPDAVDVTSDASANTFGAWTQIDASAAASSWISHVTWSALTDWSGQNYKICLEIGTGANPNEAAKIRFSFAARANFATEPSTLVFAIPKPIKVAASTRVVARMSTSYAAAMTAIIGVSYYNSLE